MQNPRRFRTICGLVALILAVGLVMTTSAYQSKTRDWSDCLYGGQPTCLLLESLNSVNNPGVGTYSDSFSTLRGGADVNCYWLIGRGFNDYGGWHQESSVRSPNASCVSYQSWANWDVLIAGYPYQGAYSGGHNTIAPATRLRAMARRCTALRGMGPTRRRHRPT